MNNDNNNGAANNNFTPNGQGMDRGVTPQPSTESAPESSVKPEASPQPVATDVAPVQSSVQPETPAQPLPVSTQPGQETIAADSQSSHHKKKASLGLILGIVGSVLAIAVIVIIVIIALNNGGGSDDNIIAGVQSGETVDTGGYTYTRNLDLEYEPVGNFHGGMLEARKGDGTIVYYNTAGKITLTLDSKYTPHGGFSDGLLAVSCADAVTEASPTNVSGDESDYDFDAPVGGYDDAKYGYIDRTGELMIPCRYDSAEEFHDGYAVVGLRQSDTDNQGMLYGVINAGGDLLADYHYSEISYVGKDLIQGYISTPDSARTGGCFNFAGEMTRSLSEDKDEVCYDRSEESRLKSIKSELKDKYPGYSIATPSEGLAAVTKHNPKEFFFVNEQGDKVWTVNAAKFIDAEDAQYQEGLIPIMMRVGDEEYTSTDSGLVPTDEDEEGSNNQQTDFYKNAGIVYYDHSGKPVFIYRYSRTLEAMETQNAERSNQEQLIDQE